MFYLALECVKYESVSSKAYLNLNFNSLPLALVVKYMPKFEGTDRLLRPSRTRVRNI